MSDEEDVVIGAIAIAPTVAALTAGVVLVLVWWVFDTAPPGSRRARFDAWSRRRGEESVRQGRRRLSFRLWLFFTVTVIVLLVWMWLAATRI